jgi:hypothetical protein
MPAQLVGTLLTDAEELGDVDESKELSTRHESSSIAASARGLSSGP